MASFSDLPSFLVSILLENFDFEDFANAFRIWKNGKNHLNQAHVLEEIDLCKFFKVGEWNTQFQLFINYASNLGVHDALFYVPAWQLVNNNGEKEDAFSVLRTLSENGHLKSALSYHFFKILHREHEEEKSIEKFIELHEKNGADRIVKRWLMDMHCLKTGWNSIKYDYRTLPTICKFAEKGFKKHFNSFSWARRIDDIESIDCCRCKVALIMYDYCNNQYTL